MCEELDQVCRSALGNLMEMVGLADVPAGFYAEEVEGMGPVQAFARVMGKLGLSCEEIGRSEQAREALRLICREWKRERAVKGVSTFEKAIRRKQFDLTASEIAEKRKLAAELEPVTKRQDLGEFTVGLQLVEGVEAIRKDWLGITPRMVANVEAGVRWFDEKYYPLVEQWEKGFEEVRQSGKAKRLRKDYETVLGAAKGAEDHETFARAVHCNLREIVTEKLPLLPKKWRLAAVQPATA